MTYKDKTYKTVCCWTADTRIKYVPNPKSGKSYIRYGGYENSKTVGESLKNGSFPLDLLFDYQTGLLSVVGGPVRKTPIDPKRAETRTDKVLSRWYYRSHPARLKRLRAAEKVFKNKSLSTKASGMNLKNKAKALDLAKGFGLKLGDFSEGMLSEVDTARKAANAEAKRLLKVGAKTGKKITNKDVLSVLQKWHFAENTARTNVNPKGRNWVYSDTLGLSRARDGRYIATGPTRQYPDVMGIMSQWLRDQKPAEFGKSFPFTSISVNYAYGAKIHRDQGNHGPSMGVAMGKFKGGQLRYWEDDDQAVPRKNVEKLLACKSKSKLVDVAKGPKLFDGRRAHSVEAFSGTRFSMVFFSAGKYWKASSKLVNFLKKDCKVEWPTDASMDYYLKTLPKPKGYKEFPKGGKSAAAKKQKVTAKKGKFATSVSKNKKEKKATASKPVKRKASGSVGGRAPWKKDRI